MPPGDWTDFENQQIVADYFDMLARELDGIHFNKSEHRRQLLSQVNRSEASIEMKHQNISAVLKGMGERWINGYKPLFNYQQPLEDAVQRWLSRHPEWFERLPESTGLADQSALYMEPAPTLRNAPPPDELEQSDRTAWRFDVAGRDERNRRLGLEGERRVFDHERTVLRNAKRKDLAEQVDWISQTQGDGAGFDIASFNPDGSRRLIEVKTTNGWERTPFHISRNELKVANEHATEWRLVRLWNFSRNTRAFEVVPPWSDTSV